VKRKQSSSARRAYRFRTTRWSVVLLAAQSQTAGFREALAELCNLYWYPLYAFVRQRGYSPEDAQDLTQGFFAHLLERKALARVDQEKADSDHFSWLRYRITFQMKPDGPVA